MLPTIANVSNTKFVGNLLDVYSVVFKQTYILVVQYWGQVLYGYLKDDDTVQYDHVATEIIYQKYRRIVVITLLKYDLASYIVNLKSDWISELVIDFETFTYVCTIDG